MRIQLGCALVVATYLLTPAVAPAAQTASDQRVSAAVLAAPPGERDGATVMGYDGEELKTLRRGDGDLICLADKPGDERFHVACYHDSLEPFMARGRELRAAGAERDEVLATREKEIESGELALPRAPRALYSLTGKLADFDAETGRLTEGNRVYVVYVPYATAEDTGLPTEPMAPGAPWLMSAGKPWAHVMVVQPAESGEPEESGE